MVVDNKNREYGEPNPTLTYTISGFKNGEMQSVIAVLPAVTTTATQASNAGTYNITAQNASDNNYSFAYQNGTLTVSKATLTVTADDKTRKVNTPNPTLTYTISGFKNNETQSVIDVLPSISTAATQSSSAGTYPITVSGASDNNYSFSYQNGTLTVSDLETQTITFNTLPAKTYGDASFTLSASASSGLSPTFESSNTNVASVAGNMLSIHNAGTAVIIAMQVGNSVYNEAIPVMQTLTIDKAPLTIIANNAVREIGLPNPQFTLSYSTFKNSETAAVLDVLPTINCSANTTSPAGFYDIVLSGGSDNNYAYTLINGTLEVVNNIVAVTGVTLNKTSTSLVVGATEQLTATVLPANATNQNVTWTSSNNSVATVINGVVSAVSSGTAVIIATTQDGGFTATCTITVTNTDGIDNVSAIQLSIYPNPVKDKLIIDNAQLIMKNAAGNVDVQIIDITGKKIVNYQLSTVNSIDVSDLPGGVYLLKIPIENHIIIKKFSKK